MVNMSASTVQVFLEFRIWTIIESLGNFTGSEGMPILLFLELF